LVATRDPSRESHFPAIEKKYGQPMSHWHRIMKSVAGKKYDEQMALLIGEHGFTRAHANALVMYSRGSTTTRRFANPEAYFASLDDTKARTMRAIFASLHKDFPDLELVVAWNQPMLKYGKKYVFGASAASQHILLAPWNASILTSLGSRLDGFQVNKKTVRVPADWKVDKALLRDMVGPHLTD
jgi:uncharacterized protein YdhG (YjbR/CyaY superfamily)